MSSYDKDKALEIIDQLKKDHMYSDTLVEACDDCSYALSLGLIAYSQHQSVWSVPDVNGSEEDADYSRAIDIIHRILCQENIFSTDVLTD